jgi:glycosyltransferase involved in cell wall biosynthesis
MNINRRVLILKKTKKYFCALVGLSSKIIILCSFSVSMSEREKENMKSNIGLVLYCFDEFSKYLKNVIDSFGNIDVSVYCFCYDFTNFNNLKDNENIVYIKMKDNTKNFNKMVNSILNNHKIWIFWKPYYIFDSRKVDQLNNIIKGLIEDKYDVSYIYGTNLCADIWHTNKNNQFNGIKGGCFISSDKVRLLEDQCSYKIDNKKYRVNYNLNSESTKFFYSIAKAVEPSYMLLECFQVQYMTDCAKKYRIFRDWYSEVKNNQFSSGAGYMEKMTIQDKQNIRHSEELPENIISMEKYQYNPFISRKKVLKGKFNDYSMTVITLVRNNKHYLKESMSSLIRQTSDKWNCVIVNDGSIHDVYHEDFLEGNDTVYRDRFKIINLKEWNGLVKCHKLALLHATNEIIGILDSDDALSPTAIADILDVYNATPEDNIFVCTKFYYCDDDMNITSEKPMPEIKTCLLNERCANHFRNFKLKYYYMTKGYDQDLQFGAEDQDILFRLEMFCTPIILEKPLYYYRRPIKNNLTISSLKILSKYSLFISIFKNITERYGNLNFMIKVFGNLETNMEYKNTRTFQNMYQKPFIHENKKYYVEIYSNNIYCFDAKHFNNIETYIELYENTGKNTFNVDIMWDNNRLEFNESNNSFDLNTYRKIHPNIYFDKIYIINLKKDNKKKERMEKIFGQYGIKYDFFDAIYGKSEPYISEYYQNEYDKTLKSPGAYGYTKSMVGIFEDALENGYKKIWVCDDDVIFVNNFLEEFDKNIRTVPFDWKVLFFGLSGPWTHPFVNKDLNNYTYQCNSITDLTNCDGSYCVGYDILILQELMDVITKCEAPFDTAIIKHMNSNPEILKFSFYPYLAIADTTKSDITEREKNIMDNFMDYQFKYRQNLGQFDIISMQTRPYDEIIRNPYPLVSIIMSVYNKEEYLDDAIKSILNQTYRNIELILVDDVSTDNCRKILEKYEGQTNIKIIYNKNNGGCYICRNNALRVAKGEIIGFQDADDYSMSTRIEKQISLMNNNPTAQMIGCLMIRSHIPNIKCDSEIELLSKVNDSIIHKNTDCCTEMFGYPTLLIKRRMFDKYGLYIERRKGMDMEFPERVMFEELGIVFEGSSWDFFNKEENKIYKRVDELLVVSPEMNQNNITNKIRDDDFLREKKWRQYYSECENHEVEKIFPIL